MHYLSQAKLNGRRKGQCGHIIINNLEYDKKKIKNNNKNWAKCKTVGVKY